MTRSVLLGFDISNGFLVELLLSEDTEILQQICKKTMEQSREFQLSKTITKLRNKSEK